MILIPGVWTINPESEMNSAKTIEEHREYLHEIVRLKIFFIWLWKQKHPNEPLQDILRNRVDIYRKTSVNTGLLNPAELHFDSPEWIELEKRLEKIYELYRGDSDAFESAGFEIFQPLVDVRVEKDFNDRSVLARYQCGSLRYDEHEKGMRVAEIGFHIANAVSPCSIFDDPSYLPKCFFDLMKQTEEKYGSTSLATTTWLNSYPPWLKLFPQEWTDSLGPEEKDVQWHYGFWGQFINAKGTFNFKLGRRLRETGELPFYPRKSSCSFSALRKAFR